VGHLGRTGPKVDFRWLKRATIFCRRPSRPGSKQPDSLEPDNREIPANQLLPNDYEEGRFPISVLHLNPHPKHRGSLLLGSSTLQGELLIFPPQSGLQVNERRTSAFALKVVFITWLVCAAGTGVPVLGLLLVLDAELVEYLKSAAPTTASWMPVEKVFNDLKIDARQAGLYRLIREVDCPTPKQPQVGSSKLNSSDQ
jgi:hypothetical protein